MENGTASSKILQSKIAYRPLGLEKRLSYGKGAVAANTGSV